MMNTATKIGLIVGAALVLLGLTVFTVVITVNHWDFSTLITSKYVTNTHPVTEDFSDIDLKVDTANIFFVLSEEGICEVVCYETENVLHSVAVEDGCLTVRVNDQRKWYEYIAIYNGTPTLTVTLPKEVYRSLVVESSTGDTTVPGDFTFDRIDIAGNTGKVECLASASGSLKLRTSTGSIRVESLSADTLEMSVTTGRLTASNIHCTGPMSIQSSTGKTTLTDVSCGSLVSSSSTGDLSLTNVVAVERFNLESDTGDIRFTKCDAAEIAAKTTTGDVTGSLLSNKVFITHTDTGRVNVPQTVTGGKCQISTDTGNIKIEIDE